MARRISFENGSRALNAMSARLSPVVIETRDANCESNLTGAIPAILLKEPVKVAAIPPITDVFIKLRRLIEFIANDFSLQR